MLRMVFESPWKVLEFPFDKLGKNHVLLVFVLPLLLDCNMGVVRFYARQQNASRILAIVWASVCSSVCLSVTLVSCIKMVQARITKSLLWAAPRSLVYRDKILCHWVHGFPSNEGVKEGYPPKKDVILPLLAWIVWKRLQICTYMLLIITRTGDRLFGFININDLEPLKKRFLVNFSQFLDAAHISTLNCDEVDGDRPRQPAYEIFSTQRRF